MKIFLIVIAYFKLFSQNMPWHPQHHLRKNTNKVASFTATLLYAGKIHNI
jgi:hypothetical protein